MRIGIDTRMIDWTGVGRYTRELLKELAQIDKENEYVLFCNQESEKLVPEAHNFRKMVVNLAPFSVTAQLAWTRLVRQEYLDVFHSPHFIFPLVAPCPSVVTIHDLIPLIRPEVIPSFIKRNYYQLQNKRAAKIAERIIAVSSATKQDVVRMLGVPGQKIEVIPEAAGRNFEVIFYKEPIKNVRAKFKLGKRFILSLGNSKPHKNWPELIKAFFKLKQEHSLSHQLVLAGKQDPRFVQSKELVAKLNLAKEVRFVEFVAEEDLPALYNAAEVFVLPSLYEGFGLPVLEAMACEKPVICSNTSSLPEVAGKGALLVDPDSEAIAKAILKVITNEATRKKLAREGRARANNFSWQKTATETLEIYKALGKKTVTRVRK